MIGFVGTTFGNARVNIADMVISRDVRPDGTAYALMLLKVDSKPSNELIDELRKHPGILRAKTVNVPDRNA